MKIHYLLPLLVLISACTTINQHAPWPAQLPPQAFFVDYYQQDVDNQQVMSEQRYLRWVQRFYLGWELYPRGWLQTMKELIQSLPTLNEQDRARQLMTALGQAVAAEWAKNGRYRVINTRHLSLWGNALSRAIVDKQQIQTLEKITQDVDDLLAKRLSPKQIRKDRYYTEMPFGEEPFGNF